MKRHKSIYWLLLLLGGLLVSCNEESEVLQAVEEEQEAVKLIDYQVALDAIRAKKPLRTNNQTQQAENYGEKGHDRRDNNSKWNDIFDLNAPVARVKVIEVNEFGEYVMKLVFGSCYMHEEIEYAFEGRTLKLCILNETGQKVNNYIIDDYHIGDTFSIPSDIFEDCYLIELYVGYFFYTAFWFVEEQLFDTLFE